LLGKTLRPGSLVNQSAGAVNIWAKGHCKKAWQKNTLNVLQFALILRNE
jgi:hypothetical protein